MQKNPNQMYTGQFSFDHTGNQIDEEISVLKARIEDLERKKKDQFPTMIELVEAYFKLVNIRKIIEAFCQYKEHPLPTTYVAIFHILSQDFENHKTWVMDNMWTIKGEKQNLGPARCPDIFGHQPFNTARTPFVQTGPFVTDAGMNLNEKQSLLNRIRELQSEVTSLTTERAQLHVYLEDKTRLITELKNGKLELQTELESKDQQLTALRNNKRNEEIAEILSLRKLLLDMTLKADGLEKQVIELHAADKRSQAKINEAVVKDAIINEYEVAITAIRKQSGCLDVSTEPEVNDAATFIFDTLLNGPEKRPNVVEAGRKVGHKEFVLEKASKLLYVRATPGISDKGRNCVVWSLPGIETAPEKKEVKPIAEKAKGKKVKPVAKAKANTPKVLTEAQKLFEEKLAKVKAVIDTGETRVLVINELLEKEGIKWVTVTRAFKRLGYKMVFKNVDGGGKVRVIMRADEPVNKSFNDRAKEAKAFIEKFIEEGNKTSAFTFYELVRARDFNKNMVLGILRNEGYTIVTKTENGVTYQTLEKIAKEA